MGSSFLLAQAAAEPGGLFGGALGPLVPFLIIGMMFYLLLIRPERRKRQELDQMLDNLKKDDHIITSGGIWGGVLNSSKGDEYVTIRVDEEKGTKLRILRSAVLRVLPDNKSDKTKDAAS